jgi:hypothetical protein
LFAVPGITLAYDSVFVTPPEVDSYEFIDDPLRLRSYYGELKDFPHTYVITLAEQTDIAIQILEPKSHVALQNMNGLIVREVERGVEDIARLYSSPTGWAPKYVAATGDTYRLGPAYSGTLEPGTYYIEVSNGDNAGKYVFQIGTVKSAERTGYFGKLKEIYLIKKFLGKPAVLVLQSPYYYVPTLILLGIALFWYRRRKKRYA